MSFPVMPCETIVRQIPDFPNYTIDIYGNVYGKIFKRFKKNSIHNGYKQVNLSKDGKGHRKFIHRILGEIFVPNPDNKTYIDHKDRNRLNNDLTNLRWITRSENNMNYSGFKKNTSTNITGVFVWDSNGYKIYQTYITKNKKKQTLTFPYTPEGLQRAIHWRLNKEIELFSEFAPCVRSRPKFLV